MRDERTFTLSLPEQLEMVLLPPLLAHLRRSAPGCKVRTAGLRWSELKLELAAGRIDLAVQIARPVEANLRQMQLLSDYRALPGERSYCGRIMAAGIIL